MESVELTVHHHGDAIGVHMARNPEGATCIDRLTIGGAADDALASMAGAVVVSGGEDGAVAAVDGAASGWSFGADLVAAVASTDGGLDAAVVVGVGAAVGCCVGAGDGAAVGNGDGAGVGATVGSGVGVGVGEAVVAVHLCSERGGSWGEVSQ